MRDSLLQTTPTALLIGGEWKPAISGAAFAVHDPADGETLAVIADAAPADALAALTAAHSAFPAWSATAPRIRSELMRACFEAIVRETEEFALLMTLEMGKPLAESRAEVVYSAEFFRWFAEEAARIGGRYATAPAGNGHFVVRHEAVGPVLAITPWNFPLAMGARKIAPALAAGCTMVIKPAEDTPLSMLRLAELMQRCGLPAGVLNVITTSQPAPVTAALLADPRLRKLTFTGSTAVGKMLQRASADNMLRTSMELGGNAPFLVFDDCVLQDALNGAMLAKMRNMGQACVAANRFLVQRDIAPAFCAALRDRLAQQKLGSGTDPGTTVGPLINERQRRTTHALVEDAIACGAHVAYRSADVPTTGSFYPVTLLTDVPLSARILKEEVFGPVAAVTVFDTEDEAIALANDTEYGLAAYVYTADLARSWRVAAALRTGMVGINRGIISDAAAPFGGVKSSGLGREGGSEGIYEYLDTKYIALP
jgi:succinate-semialdehyde dehydrogenase/glutarate-semialdehyde dehydrogenase